eukprot:COSAG05_NODE_650_length_8102_cov_16.263383_11_plen_94_part_00
MLLLLLLLCVDVVDRDTVINELRKDCGVGVLRLLGFCFYEATFLLLSFEALLVAFNFELFHSCSALRIVLCKRRVYLQLLLGDRDRAADVERP